MTLNRILFSAHPEYLRVAAGALRDEVADAAVEFVGPDVAALATEAVGIDDVATLCRSVPIPFVRHLASESVRLAGDDTTGTARTVAEHVARLVADAALDTVGLQVWTSGDAAVRSEGLRATIADRLRAAGAATTRRDAAQVVSVCATATGISVGLTGASSMLCDWPGGRVRLRAGREQVSRAEFKLEELLQLFPLALPPRGRALDLGASPGGWTRLLRTYDLEVVAVDPGDLDGRVRRDPGVRHERTTAGRYLASSSERFDLVVNDMRMEPVRSAQIVVDAADRLAAGGRAIVTLKVTPRTARADVRAALRRLDARYRLLFARQLHHNRNEVTIAVERGGTDG